MILTPQKVKEYHKNKSAMSISLYAQNQKKKMLNDQYQMSKDQLVQSEKRIQIQSEETIAESFQRKQRAIQRKNKLQSYLKIQQKNFWHFYDSQQTIASPVKGYQTQKNFRKNYQQQCYQTWQNNLKRENWSQVKKLEQKDIYQQIKNANNQKQVDEERKLLQLKFQKQNFQSEQFQINQQFMQAKTFTDFQNKQILKNTQASIYENNKIQGRYIKQKNNQSRIEYMTQMKNKVDQDFCQWKDMKNMLYIQNNRKVYELIQEKNTKHQIKMSLQKRHKTGIL